MKIWLDIGDVLSPKHTGPKRFGYDAVDALALPFLSLYAARYEPHNIFVLSRTTRGNGNRAMVIDIF